MATRLDDAKIRVILDLTGAQGGGGDGGGAPGSPDGGDADGRGGKSPDGPPIPGTPTPEERERRRPRTPPNAPSPSITPDGGSGRVPGIAPRPGQTILDATALGLRRGAPAGMRTVGSRLGAAVGVGARLVGAAITAEEVIRTLGPALTSALDEIVRAQLPAMLGINPVDVGIADTGQIASDWLNRFVAQPISAGLTASSRTMQLERSRMLLGGQFSEARIASTFMEEADIAYQQDLAESTFDRTVRRKIGESIGKELGRRVRQNMGR